MTKSDFGRSVSRCADTALGSVSRPPSRQTRNQPLETRGLPTARLLRTSEEALIGSIALLVSMTVFITVCPGRIALPCAPNVRADFIPWGSEFGFRRRVFGECGSRSRMAFSRRAGERAITVGGQFGAARVYGNRAHSEFCSVVNSRAQGEGSEQTGYVLNLPPLNSFSPWGQTWTAAQAESELETGERAASPPDVRTPRCPIRHTS